MNLFKFYWNKIHRITHREISYPGIMMLFLLLLEGGITNFGIANLEISNPKITYLPIEQSLCIFRRLTREYILGDLTT